MVWGILARLIPTIARKVAPGAATKVARLIPKVTRAVAGRMPAGVMSPIRKIAAKAGLGRVAPAAIAPIRTLPVATRPTTVLQKAVVEQATAFIKKPFRTTLPYAATAGLMGAVSRMGKEKGVTGIERGAVVGEALGVARIPTAADRARILAKTGVEPMAGRRLPATVGEVPLVEPEIVRSWSTGTTEFIVDSTGQHWVLTKRGWKKYTPKKPIVLGTKHLTPKKFIAAAKKYYSLKKDLDKVFKTVKRKK